MAEQLAPVALHALRMTGENYDTITASGKKGVAQARLLNPRKKNKADDYDDNDDRDYYYSRRQVTRDTRDPPDNRDRARSVGNYYDRDSRGRDSGRRANNDYDAYDSEASIPPVNRRRDGSSRGSYDQRSSQAVSTRGGGRSTRSTRSSRSSSSSSSSSDSEDLGSSTDDEKKEKKIRRSELISGGLAAVASVHAAGTVWGSMEARDAREEAVANGDMSKEQAKKERRKNQFQDVAALGLAALALKGAYGKWKGTAATHQQKRQHKREKAERHEKRVQKGVDRESRRSRNGDGGGGGGRRQLQDGGGGGGGKKQITDGRPGYSRGYSRSETDLRGYDNRGYDRDYDRGYDRRDDDYQRYSRDV